MYWARDGRVEAVSAVPRADVLTLDGSPPFVDTASQLGWPCTPIAPLARASFDACKALGEGQASARLIQIVASDGVDDASLPFDPELNRETQAYWILRTAEGRYVDAHDEMVFGSAQELVQALFVDAVTFRGP